MFGSMRLASLPNAVSASTATTRSSWRSSANTDPTQAATVVLPTPPLPSTPILYLPRSKDRILASSSAW